MATPKRKYSFGLASRLAVIGAFVGFGSWAVFNSKFKKEDPEAVAKANPDSEDEKKESEDGKEDKERKETKEAKASTTFPSGSKAQPAAFVEKTKPGKIKLDDKKENKTPPKSSVSFSPTSTSKKSSSSPPPSSSFSMKGSNSGGNSGFSPPNSKSFTAAMNSKSSTSQPPSSTGFSSPNSFSSSKSNSSKKKPDANQPTKESDGKNRDKKSSSGKASTKSEKSDDDQKGPPSSSFNPGIASKSTGSTSPGKSVTADSSKSSVPPSTSFSSATKSSGPPSSTFNPGVTKSSSSGFNPQSNAKSDAGKSGPPSATFDPRGNFQPGTNSSSTKFAGSSSSTNGGFDGGFQSRSSDGKEKPLRSVSSGSTTFSGNTSNSKSTATNDQVGNPAFSLSSDNQRNGATGNPPPSINNTAPAKSSAAFGGGSAFQDKGSKPLVKENQPRTNSLNKSTGGEGLGSSSTGFADIGNADKKGTGNGLNLDPRNLKSNANSNTAPSNNALLSGNKSRNVSPSVIGSQGSSSTNTKFASNPNLKGAIQPGTDDRKPGPSSLEGIQTPAITLQKLSPREIQVDVEASFQLVVRNVGRSTASNILIVDPIPEGTQFVSADPAPTDRGTDGSLIWKIGALDPNQQQVINVKLLPKRQGEIGSVARMSFQAAATAKTICTKPELTITHAGPQKILKGQTARFRVTIQNNGDGVARDVVIEDEVPPGFAFGNGQGSRLAYEVGNLPPGARREVTLSLRAVEPGRYVNEIRAKMGKTTMSNHKLDVEVTTPKLKMEVVGPTRRYIQREARYSIEVQNTGTATAQNVLMVTRLPKGLKFVRTNNRGQYNPREHSVYWSMVELSPQNKGTVELVLMPIGTGQQEIEFESKSMLDRTKLQKFPVIVDQLAELFFEVDDRDDPIEVNGETEYRVRVVNQGSKAATEVVVAVEMPNGIQATDTKGPTKGSRSGEKIVFAPVNSLAPRGELIYRIKARGVRDGNHLIKVLVSSNERREAVAKQESTKVYSEYR